MFYTVTDNAVARYTTDNGTSIAVAYDECADNPLEFMDAPLGIQSLDRHGAGFDPAGVLEDYLYYREMLESGEDCLASLEVSLEEFWETEEDRDPVDLSIMDDYETALEELKDIVFFEWRDTDEWGWPGFRVAYRVSGMREAGYNAERLDDIAKDMAREFSAWANGSVYVVGVENADGEAEYIGGFVGIDPNDADEIRGLVEDHGFDAEGLRSA